MQKRRAGIDDLGILSAVLCLGEPDGAKLASRHNQQGMAVNSCALHASPLVFLNLNPYIIPSLQFVPKA